MTWFNTDDPAADVQAARDLLDQQEYEFERALADMQLAVRQLSDLVDRREPTADAVQTLRELAGNVKHALRDARYELAEASSLIEAAIAGWVQLDDKRG